MAQPIDGVHQAGADRAQRIAQMLEQRHLQTEMAAAAHARHDRRRAEEVARPRESHRSAADTDDGHAGGGRREGAPRHPRERGGSPPEADPGRVVDLSA
jgi:hypothetical protein